MLATYLCKSCKSESDWFPVHVSEPVAAQVSNHCAIFRSWLISAVGLASLKCVSYSWARQPQHGAYGSRDFMSALWSSQPPISLILLAVSYVWFCLLLPRFCNARWRWVFSVSTQTLSILLKITLGMSTHLNCRGWHSLASHNRHRADGFSVLTTLASVDI